MHWAETFFLAAEGSSQAISGYKKREGESIVEERESNKPSEGHAPLPPAVFS